MNNLLGPHDAATVVLFKAQFKTDLPKKTDIKRLLHVTDLNFYRSRGQHNRTIECLERALDIVRGNSERRFSRTSSYTSTDYAVMHADVGSNLFLQLKYASELIEGFNLTYQALEELEELNDTFREMLEIREDYDRWVKVALSNRDRLERASITDAGVSDLPFDIWQKQAEHYGRKAVDEARQRVTVWLEKYTWSSHLTEPHDNRLIAI
jgi:tetratricopeptide (TPR) repeat protein